MQYSPKLKKAMDQIKAILVQNDIAGSIVLHTPEFSEYLVHIDTSYSCAKWEGDSVRIRAKLADFGGDKKAWAKKTGETSNMVHHLAHVSSKIGASMKQLDEILGAKIGAEHFGGGHSSHTQQNN